MKKGLPLLLLVLIVSMANAQTIITDRPAQTEASSTVGKRVLQIESGFTFTQSAFGTNGQMENYAWNTLWRVGVSKCFELRIVTQPEANHIYFENFDQRSSGITDLQVGFKVNILEAKKGARKSVFYLIWLFQVVVMDFQLKE